MSIIERQELPENIELLAAQKNIYSRAKNIIGFQMILSVPIAICAVIITIVKPELKGYIAIWGILVVLFDLFVFTPWVKKLQDNAARIQELFDVKVFGLSWNEISVGKRPDPELVHEEAKKHGVEEEQIIGLKEWYPVSIDRTPEIFGIIISQRSNVWWDARMRRKYTLSIRIVLVGIALGLTGYGLYEKKDMFEFLAYIIAPLASTYIFGYRQMTDHGDAADRLDKLKETLGNAVTMGESDLLEVADKYAQETRDKLKQNIQSDKENSSFLGKLLNDFNEYYKLAYTLSKEMVDGTANFETLGT